MLLTVLQHLLVLLEGVEHQVSWRGCRWRPVSCQLVLLGEDQLLLLLALDVLIEQHEGRRVDGRLLLFDTLLLLF